YADEVAAAARRAGLRVELDRRNEKINYKVREHSLAKVPVLLVVGKKEVEERAVSIRRLGSQEQKGVGLDEAVAGRDGEAVGAGCRGLDLDRRNEKINDKVREHSLAKVPVLLVVGKKEVEERAVSIRRLGSQEQKVVGLDEAVAGLTEEAVAPDVRRGRA